MKISFKNPLLPFVATVAFCLIPTFGTAGAFIKISEIAGESTGSDRRDWITALSISQSSTRTSIDNGHISPKPIFEDLKVSKELDKSSPLLQRSLLLNQSIPNVIIELTRPSADGTSEVYLRYELRNVKITKYAIDTAGEAAGDSIPAEEFSLNFEEIRVTYTSVSGDTTEFGYNLEEDVSS
ncbi:type VI secretion system tube protein Hcp [Verrucomicrobiales bacterium]|nr:type VI secretion system tube protein Hcp [Verrucomicrobiales bacterium]